MNIHKIVPLAANIAGTPGKHKIPRFIYHLTTPDNYEKIIRDGVIKPTEDVFYGDGIFALDLANFFKCWRCNEAWGYDNLMSRLLWRVAGSNSELCILKIPTRKLNTDVLVIRSQNRLFCPLGKSNMSPSAKQKIEDFVSARVANGDSRQDSNMLALEKFCPEIAEHIEMGTPAKFSKLFKQRKEAIEYIYPEEISADCVEKLGEVNIPELIRTNDFDFRHPLRSIFSKLLKNTPEEKNVIFINN